MTEQERSHLRNKMANIKLHVDQLETWCLQVNKMIYDLEEKLFDQEDADLNKFLYGMGL